MKHLKITPTDQKIFLIKSSFWLVFLGWAAFALTLFGIFYQSFLAAIFLTGAFWATWHFFRKKLFSAISLEFIVVTLCLAAFAIGISFYVTPTIFSGRDQGAISEAAIRLAQNHHLEFSTPASQEFFKIYGPGRALNFPGFYYQKDGQLITQFPLVYIAWLAMFFAFFGITGFVIANAILLYFFLLTFYFLARHFLNTKLSLLLMLFTMASFSTYWFAKFTLSENMALPLVWLTIFSLLLFWEERTLTNLNLFFFTSFLLVFTRIEGIALLLASLLILLIGTKTRTFLFSNSKRKLFPFLLFFIFFLILNTFKDLNFYKEIFKALLPSLRETPLTAMDAAIIPPFKEFFLGEVFLLYGYLGFMLIGSIGIAWLFVEKHFKMLFPFFITLPTWVYLIDSHISSDQPWMLRRYAFTIVPVFIFYTICFFQLWNQKRTELFAKIFAFALIIFLFAGSTPALMNFFTYSENESLLEENNKFAQNFSSRDLILMDNAVSGNGWAMLTGPLNFISGKNAVYFFNPKDLAKINTEKFENVYLIVPSGKEKNYAEILPLFVSVKAYAIKANRLEISQGKIEEPTFPKKEMLAFGGTIFKLKK